MTRWGVSKKPGRLTAVPCDAAASDCQHLALVAPIRELRGADNSRNYRRCWNSMHVDP